MVQKLWRVVLGSDDAGFEYKERVKQDLESDPRVGEVIDVGVGSNSHTDYPHIAVQAARLIRDGEADRGVLICGTGLGMAISANKVNGVRAVTAHDSYSVERSVLSNDAQILCMGQRVAGIELVRHLVDGWLDLEFDRSGKSATKVEAINAYDQNQQLPILSIDSKGV